MILHCYIRMFFLDFETVPKFTYKTDSADREAAAE